MKVDGTSAGKSELKTYTAHKNNVSVRLEAYDIITVFIKINNRTLDCTLKSDHTELVCLREVLNKWYAEEYKE